MKRIKSVNTVPVYEVDGVEVTIGKDVELEVRSHWNRSEMAVLKFNNAVITVSAHDLEIALDNATNEG